MPRTIRKTRRSRTSCSLIALATVLAVGASPASAQSLLGTGNYVTNPVAGGITTAPNTTNIALNPGNTIIEWTPTDNASGTGTNILFQPAGTTANFSASSNFAVLNRIMVNDATRAIVMDGTVNGIVGGNQGGSIYFYSPGGFIFGGNSVFNLASLVVTSLGISDASFANVGSTGYGSVTFDQALTPGSSISMNGTVNAFVPALGFGGASGPGYVAMVAPRVIHNGTITANGSTALVAAEAATINFTPDGLFDIEVTVGSTSTSGVEVYGDITGPTPTGAADQQRIYLVAVPKNDAMTMIIGNGADLGFTLANTAVDDNGVIVLSAGHDIVGGEIGARSAGHGANATGNFWFTGARAANNLVGEATGQASLYSVAPNLTTTFDNDLTVHAASINMSASGIGTSLTVGGDLSLSTNVTGTAGQSVTAGNIDLFAANGGILSFAGSSDLTADGIGGSANSGTAGSGTGGNIAITANDSSALTLSNLTTSATGTGGDGLAAGVHAGHGTGGTISMTANNGGSIVMNSPLLFDAQGYGGSASGAGLAGNGMGGNASILAGNNAAMTFNGDVTLDAGGIGGAHSSGPGGTGSGGTAQTDLLNNSTLLVTGNLALSASGTGGAGGSGGLGQGGIANIGADFGASSGSTMTVDGDTNVLAEGYGGDASGTGGTGGNAIGGDAFMGGNANSYAFNGNLTVSAIAEGGASQSGLGGSADGGTAALDSTGASVLVGNTVSILADGVGGDGASGGDGSGGFARIRSVNIDVDGDAFVSAGGTGGFGFAGDGGDGFGGTAQLQAQNGGVSIAGMVFANADGSGGGSENSGSLSGNGLGGSVAVQALANGVFDVNGALLASADGFGGGNFGFGTNTGSGTGGSALLQASGANAVVTLGSYATVTANGEAGPFCGECGGGGLAGSGFGGSVTVQAVGADTASLTITGSLDAEADGQGGDAITGNGGAGSGGWVYFAANDGADLLILGSLSASAEGWGGYSYGPGDGGQGTGGSVTLAATDGGTLAIDGGGYLDADGYGGDAGISASGDGGDGFGGDVNVYASSGAIDFDFLLLASANGIGGYADNGNGGDGTGGRAQILTTGSTAQLNVLGNVTLEASGYGGSNYNEVPSGDGGDGIGGRTRAVADGGLIHITGNLEMDAAASGGSGANGGDATAVTTPPNNEAAEPAAFLWAGATDAELRVDGLTDIDVGAIGGDGMNGNGGNAVAGEVDIVSQLGDVTLGNVIGNAEAHGGDGSNGGTGGDATGGNVDVAWSLSGGALTGTIAIGSLDLSASAYGGDGGAGINANSGGNGGSGGNGTGGALFVVASAAGGTLNIGAATLAADGIGGTGGSGGSGDGGAGGNGGAGGAGTGGSVFVGSISSNLNPGSGGSATFTTLSGSASAVGGAGGDGGDGGGGIGAGGDGGSATGGATSFLVRGIPVTADAISLFANATGGDGGSGSVAGDGGNAIAGSIAVESKDRFDFPAQRGSLTANSITGTAIATGGSGTVAGSSTVPGGSYFRVLNGDATIGTVSLTFAGGQYDGALGPHYIQAQDGTATIGSFSYVTPGDLAIFTTSTGILDVGTLTLSAGNFIDHPTLAGPASPGTIFADSALISTGGDFVADANWDVTNTFAVDAPGLIDLDNVVGGNGIDFSAGGTIAIESIDAGTYVDLLAGGSIDIFGPLAAGSFVAASAGTDLTFTTLDAGGYVDLMAGTDISGTTILAGGSIALQAGGDIGLGGATSSFGGIVMAAGDDISLADDLLSDGDILLTAGGDIVGGNMDSGQDITLAAPGTITALDITAGGIFMALARGDMSFGDATASEVFLSDYAVVTAGGVITATCVGTCGMSGADGVVTASPTGSPYAFVTTEGGVDGAGQLPGEGGTNGSVYTTSEFTVAAGDDLEFWFNYVTSDGSGFADYAWAALLNSDLTPVAILYTARTQPSGTIVPGLDLPGVEATLNPSSVPIIDGAPTWSPLGSSSGTCYDAGCGYTGWVSSTYDISQAGDYILQFGVTNWTDTGFQSGMAFSSLSIGGVAVAPVLLTRTGGSISIGNVNTGQFSAAAGTSLTTGIISSGGDISLDAGAAITTGNLTAGDFVLANGGSITTGNIDADSVAMTSTGGDIATGNIIAFGAIGLDASGDILAGNITGGSIDLLAGDGITTGDLTTQFLVLLAQEDGIGPQQLYPGASITLEAGGDIATGDIDSIDGVYAQAGGSLAAGTINAVDFVELSAAGNVATGAIDAGTYLLVGSGGNQALGNLAAGWDIDLEAAGNIAFGDANAGTDFDFEADGNVNGGNIVAGVTIEGEAGGTVTLGNLTAGFDPGEAVDDDTFSIGIQAEGAISVGNAQGANRVGFATLGNLTTGSIQSGWDFFAFADGNIVTGAITTGEGDQVFMSGTEAFFAAGGGEDSDFDPDAALAGDPSATGGSITINGPVNTGQFDAAAGTGLTTQAITASGDIHASAGGTATLNGVWNSGGDVNLASNDIDIGGGGGISAAGDVGLFSTNATQALIGDGLSGSGYALSNAEFGRISGTNVGIGARGDASAAIDMLIGNLTVTGPLVGSTVEGADGILAFAVGDIDSETIGGVIRVNGNVAATGFGPANAIEFHADRFELNAATGSVSILSSGTTLGGELGIYADRIHVAEASILDQLAANPTYTGYQEDLNEAASVQRPEGVLRADTLWIESDNLQSVLIQNTGTFETRAGFLVREAFINDDEEIAGPPGSINLVVNGQVVTEGGTLTGVAARDALVDEETDITPFTSNSTINGCPLTGACIIAPPPPPPTANLVENQIDLIGRNPIGENEFEDNQEGGEGSSNPIAPPQPLFDTRPLVPSGDVNDPVSGTGNPALLGSEGQCEEEENGQCAAPVDGEGQ